MEASVPLERLGEVEALGPAAITVRRRLLDLIAAGELRGGQRLGAERDLAARLGVSRSTLRRALSVLERDGVVRRVPGRGGGTFVTPPKVERDLSRLVGLPSMLRDQGFVAGTRLLRASVVDADPRCARALDLRTGALVISVVRIRLADGAPLSLEHVRLPADRFPDLLEQALGGSLYELLRTRYGVTPARAEERIEVHAADPEQAAILQVGPGAPLLAVTRTSWDGAGHPLEHSLDLFRADRTAITIRAEGGVTPAAPIRPDQRS